MEATPFEQDVVAEALKATGPETVAPLAGAVTDTPAKAADTVTVSRHTISDKDFDMLGLQTIYLLPAAELHLVKLPSRVIGRVEGFLGSGLVVSLGRSRLISDPSTERTKELSPQLISKTV